MGGECLWPAGRSTISLGIASIAASSIPKSCGSSRRRASSNTMGQPMRAICAGFSMTTRSFATERAAGAKRRFNTARARALGRIGRSEFHFAAAFGRFQAGYQVDFDCDISRRGSRSGEMIARCIVEVGTSSYYTALHDAAREPVLREICGHIAADEIRHYKLFYQQLDALSRTRARSGFAPLRVAARPIAESQDDELAYAYHAANESSRPYDRRAAAVLMRGAPIGYGAGTTSRTASPWSSRRSG